MPRSRWSTRAALRRGGLLVATLLSLALFAPALRVGFVSDDYPHLLLARRIAWADVLSPIPGVLHYSPMSIAWRKLLDGWAGSDVLPWHAAALVLLVGAAVLAGSVARGLGSRPLEAACVTAIFPSLACAYEPVVWSTVNVYLLALCLHLGALASYLAFQRSGRWKAYAVSLLLATLALLTLESAAVFVPSLILLELARGGRRAAWAAWPRYVVPALLTLLVLSCSGDEMRARVALPAAEVLTKRAGHALVYLSSFNQSELLRAYFASRPLRLMAVPLVGLAAILMLFKGPARVRALGVFAIMHYAPFIVSSAHHPRYFLFAATGMAALWMVAPTGLSGLAAHSSVRAGLGRGSFRLALTLVFTALVVIAGAVHTRERIQAWLAASAGVESAKSAISSALPAATGTLVLVDFPEMQARYHDVDWPAYMFLSAFNDKALLRTLDTGPLPALELLSTSHDPARPRLGSSPVDPLHLPRLASRCGHVVLRFQDSTNSVEPVAPGGGPCQ